MPIVNVDFADLLHRSHAIERTQNSIDQRNCVRTKILGVFAVTTFTLIRNGMFAYLNFKQRFRTFSEHFNKSTHTTWLNFDHFFVFNENNCSKWRCDLSSRNRDSSSVKQLTWTKLNNKLIIKGSSFLFQSAVACHRTLIKRSKGSSGSFNAYIRQSNAHKINNKKKQQ